MNSSFRKILALNEVGSVSKILQQYDPKIGLNEGDGKYLIKAIPSPTQKPMIGKSTEITIPLTDSNIDVVEFTKSYFSLSVNVDLDFDPGFPVLPDVPDAWMAAVNSTVFGTNSTNKVWWNNNSMFEALAKMTYFFVGFKSATDIISSYKITNRNIDVGGTQTNNAQIESFLYNFMKAKTEKDNKRNTHSLWENVHSHNPSVCGRYFSLWDLHIAQQSGRKLHVEFPVIIGFDDFLPFQFFSLYPSSVFGELSLVIRVSPDAMVWCSVDPVSSILEQVDISSAPVATTTGFTNPVLDLKKIATNISTKDRQHYYDKRFIQLNAPGVAATNVIASGDTGAVLATFAGHDLTVRADNIMIIEAVSTVCGFGLNPIFHSQLVRYYTSTPMVIPGEIVRTFNFSTGPNAGGLNCVATLPMINVKEVIVLFPRYATDLTVFHNPCLSNLQIQMLSRNWPDQPASTVSAEFFRLQLEAANLDSILHCTESFENSYTCIPTYNYPYRDRSRVDNTDFAFILPTERGSGNAFFFDGVNSVSETIQLKGTPLSVDLEGNQIPPELNTYYRLNRNNDNHAAVGAVDKLNRTAPILSLVSDTFFIFQVGQLAVYETGHTWNEIFSTRFPDLYDKLLAIVEKDTLDG
jgi:hypothetical protein